MEKYLQRFIDKDLEECSKDTIMVVIDGVKGCGKSEAAKRIMKSRLVIDKTEKTQTMLQNNPDIVLQGERPRVIDEWQVNTWIWNKIRHEIDDKREGEGCFILTGSSTPSEDENRHSGAGRVIRYKMRPMSWHERGWSIGEITLDDVLNNKIKTTKLNELNYEEKIQRLMLGGWPFLIEKTSFKNQMNTLKEYSESIWTDDLLRVDGIIRNSKIGENLLKSLARNVGQAVSIQTLLDDIKIHDESISFPTLSSYFNVLERIHIIEDLPAWSTHIRSTNTLRKASKRYFVDPSLAISCLGMSLDKLKHDPNYLGFLFENEVVKNLRIYAEQVDAKLYYFNTNFRTTIKGEKILTSKEVDIIIEFKDGNWAAFEVKLGFNDASIQSGVDALNNLMNSIDFEKVKKPLSLNIITCDGFAYKRKEDGINVIPLNVLGGNM